MYQNCKYLKYLKGTQNTEITKKYFCTSTSKVLKTEFKCFPFLPLYLLNSKSSCLFAKSFRILDLSIRMYNIPLEVEYEYIPQNYFFL